MGNVLSAHERQRVPHAVVKAQELQAKGDLRGAEAIYRSLLKQRPKDFNSLCSLAGLLWQGERYEDAIPFLRRAINQRSNSAIAHTMLAVVLYSIGRQEEARERARRAIACDCEFPEAHNALAQIMVAMGSYEEAIAAQERAIELAPNQPRYYFGLGTMQTWDALSPRFKALKLLADKSSALVLSEQIYLQFALSKAYHDFGDIERSFRHQIKGGSLKRSSISYKEHPVLVNLENLSRVVDSEWIRERVGSGNPSSSPIFILGMPRSGSTLVEQILASHSHVQSIGERTFFQAALEEVTGRSGDLPSRAGKLARSDVNKIGARYIEVIRAQSSDGEIRMIDKTPLNFQYVGLIHAALPNARIIHTVRNPIDTCLSIFSILFPAGSQPYSYDLGELGRFYSAYRKIMAYWHRVLPAGVMLDVQYEDIVDDFEAQSRRIISHCGLAWEDACLSFHKLRRSIMTASHAQVRQPIYRSSIGRRRPPDTLLQPLLDALGAETINPLA